MNIIEQLQDLHKQATTERSHFYVAKTCEAAIEEIEYLSSEVKRLRHWVEVMQPVCDSASDLIKSAKHYDQQEKT